ncbi:diguanylate cyclase [Colwellia sp. D2M02]|uniref:diguanylate cyclase n=1 Tax=Colwellia asteriadis TaxID=517723 RepID=A0ABP3WBN8_9GAMM|nr:diguanylate cyclase [Colwellia sp. D2M02]MBU2893104.1 diguanylate cyclase [Colwellia sp. D2M02]
MSNTNESAPSTTSLPSDVVSSITNQVSDQLNTGVLVVDRDFKVVMWNRFIQVHANKSSEEVVGRLIFDVFPELPQRWFERKLSGVLQLNTPSFSSWEQRHHLFELPHTRPITTDSEFMAQNCTFLPLDVAGEHSYICILIEDVTDVCHYQGQLQKTLKELALISRIDGLTQIFNRRHWQESLEQEYAKARRHNKKLALIMLDLDHFKKLNDNYGHQGGDKALIDVTQIVKSVLRIEDVFGRYGGEEFAIILPETDIQGALDLAQRVCNTVAKTPVLFQEHIIQLSVSIGVSQLSDNDTSYEKLIANADAALYQAKANGRNQVFNALDLSDESLSA